MNFVRYYDDVMSLDVCNEFIEQSRLITKKRDISSTISTFKSNNYSSQLILCVNNAIEYCHKKYREEFDLDYLNHDKHFVSWRVHLSEKDGGELAWHVDDGIVKDNIKDINNNIVAFKNKVFIIYLNDMNEGELKFKYFPDIHIMPKAGRMLIMPAGWVWTHGTEKISKEKYIIVGALTKPTKHTFSDFKSNENL